MTVTQPTPANNQSMQRDETIAGGLLVQLLNVDFAHALDNVSNIAFYDQASGEYRSGAAAINDNSITRVRITYPGEDGSQVTRHYLRIANDDGTGNGSGFKANAWLEIDAQTGQPIAGRPVQVCCAGFSGNMVELAFSTPTTSGGHSTMAAYHGQFNPQNNDAAGFLGNLTSAAQSHGATLASAHVYGHSAGAGPGLTIYAGLLARGTQCDATLVEPLQPGPQLEKILDEVCNPSSQLSQQLQGSTRTREQWRELLLNPERLTSVVGVREGSRGLAQRFLGNGIGNVLTVNVNSQRGSTSMETAIADHRALTSVQALTQGPGTRLQSAGVAPANGRPENMQDSGDIGQMIMSIIMSLLSGEGFGGIMGGVMQMLMTSPANGDPNGPQNTPPGGSGNRPPGQVRI